MARRFILLVSGLALLGAGCSSIGGHAASSSTTIAPSTTVAAIDTTEQFDGQVFGATIAMQMGDRVNVVALPDGGPGVVLIERGEGEADTTSAVIKEVPDLAAARDRAVASGNQIEILQVW